MGLVLDRLATCCRHTAGLHVADRHAGTQADRQVGTRLVCRHSVANTLTVLYVPYHPVTESLSHSVAQLVSRSLTHSVTQSLRLVRTWLPGTQDLDIVLL